MFRFAPGQLQGQGQLVGGTWTTVAAVDTIDTGLTSIQAANVSFNSDPGDANLFVSCSFSGGILTIKTWKTADGTDPTPVAASAFSKIVNWLVLGY